MAALKVKSKQGKRVENKTAEALRALLPGAQARVAKAKKEVGISKDELRDMAYLAALSADGEARLRDIRREHGEAARELENAENALEGFERAIIKASTREREAEISKVHKQLLDVFARRTAAAREVRDALETLAVHYVKVEDSGIELIEIAKLVPALNPPSDPALDPARDPGRELPSEVYDGAAASVVASEPNVKRVRKFKIPWEVNHGFRPENLYQEMLDHLGSVIARVKIGHEVVQARDFAQATRNWQADLLREFSDFYEGECPALMEGNTTGE